MKRAIKLRKSVTFDKDQTDVFADIPLVFYHLTLLSGKVKGFLLKFLDMLLQPFL